MDTEAWIMLASIVGLISMDEDEEDEEEDEEEEDEVPTAAEAPIMTSSRLTKSRCVAEADD